MKNKTKKAVVRVISFILVLIMAVMSVPETAGAEEPRFKLLPPSKGYELPYKVGNLFKRNTRITFHPSRKDYLNRDYHIMPGCMCGTDSDKSYKTFNKKVLEDPNNDKYCVVWPVTKDYKGGIPRRAKYLAELAGKKCWYYPGYADELELFAPDELEKKVIEILKGRGYKYVPEMLERQYNTGVITKKEYKEYTTNKCCDSWTEIAYPANLKSNKAPVTGSRWNLKNRHSVDAYAKDLADAIEKRMLNGYKNLDEYKESRRKLYGEDEDYEGQYAPSFDLNYCGIESYLTGWPSSDKNGIVRETGIRKYPNINVDYVWKIY